MTDDDADDDDDDGDDNRISAIIPPCASDTVSWRATDYRRKNNPKATTTFTAVDAEIKYPIVVKRNILLYIVPTIDINNVSARRVLLFLLSLSAAAAVFCCCCCCYCRRRACVRIKFTTGPRNGRARWKICYVYLRQRGIVLVRGDHV